MNFSPNNCFTSHPSSKNMDSEQLQSIAKQLAHPSGEKGLEMAEMMHATNLQMTLHAIEQMNLQPNDQVLEIGHGSAKHLDKLFDKHETLSYTGLEISELMHQQAKQYHSQALPEMKAQFVLVDGETIPFHTAEFDKIFTVNTLYFWKNPLTFLSEIAAVLKPTGRFCITFAHKDFMQTLPFTQFGFRLYHPKELLVLISQSPFELVEKQTASEIVVSKMGDRVVRNYSTFVLQLKRN